MNLVKKPNGTYVVINNEGNNKHFETVDQACDHLQDDLSVPEDQIEAALISLHTNKHNWAIFNKEGCFSHTEAE